MRYLGFDIGGTKCAALVADESGKVLFREEIPSGSPSSVLPALFRIADGFPKAVCAGISCGGPLDEERGLILSPPNLPLWDAVPITRMVEEHFGIRAALMNDADAGALAEWRFGAGQGTRNMAFLTFGTGLGAGLILNGSRYRGASGFAGELGHIRLAGEGPAGYGKEGSFEGFASGGGIAQTARTAALAAIQRGEAPLYAPTVSGLETITAKSVAQAAEAGDSLARDVYARVGAWLGRGLSILVDLLNPELIAIGGIFPRAEHLLRAAMEEELKNESLAGALAAVRIVPAALGERIGDLAALSIALELERSL